MEQILSLIRTRRSVRTYDGSPLKPEHREAIAAFMADIPTPWGITPAFRLLEAAEHGLKSPVLAGESLYFAAKLPREPHAEEALGYAFEKLVLYAWSLGIGTVWLGGTLNREAFEKAMDLAPGEFMPCASPLGYPAKKPSLRESLMRKGVGADTRLPFGDLFFDGDFSRPLRPEAAGALARPLEAVRLGPSAVNKQPWRAAVLDGAVHFCLKRNKGLAGDASTGDLQKIDLGIALCHFALTAEEDGLKPSFFLEDPGLETEADMAYIASYRVSP